MLIAAHFPLIGPGLAKPRTSTMRPRPSLFWCQRLSPARAPYGRDVRPPCLAGAAGHGAGSCGSPRPCSPRAGLPGREAALAVRLIYDYTLGLAFADPTSPAEQRLRDFASREQLHAFFRSQPASRFPTLAAHGVHAWDGDRDQRFTAGLETLPRGLQADHHGRVVIMQPGLPGRSGHTTAMKTTIVTAGAVAAAAAIGAVAADPGSAWYRSLRKPRWQPPCAEPCLDAVVLPRPSAPRRAGRDRLPRHS